MNRVNGLLTVSSRYNNDSSFYAQGTDDSD